MPKETRPRPSGQRRAAAQRRTPDRRRTPQNRRTAKKAAPKRRRVYRRLYPEFKPDSSNVSLFKTMRFTAQQRLELLRWVLYVAVCILCLVVQDTMMSRVSFFDTTTDLAVGAMMLIAVIEGSEVGSVFILIASLIYYFSGSAPGPYSVGMLSILGLAASLFRQSMWHRSAGSIIACAGLAVMVYELGLYVVGMFLGLTSWYRLPRFFLTGVLTVAVMIPLYYLIYRIGTIGGNTWKE